MRKNTKEKTLGILMFSGGKRLRGDIGAEGTFPFPVSYGVAEGSYRDLVEGSEAAKRALCAAAEKLVSGGAYAIAGDCGLMSLYQKELSRSAGVPVVASSLTLLPAVRRITSAPVCVITGHSRLLKKRHLGEAAQDAGVRIAGMENMPHFSAAVIEGKTEQDMELMRRDTLRAVRFALEKHPDTGSILFECSNLTPFSGDVWREFGLPVFDIAAAAWLMAMTAGNYVRK